MALAIAGGGCASQTAREPLEGRFDIHIINQSAADVVVDAVARAEGTGAGLSEGGTSATVPPCEATEYTLPSLDAWSISIDGVTVATSADTPFPAVGRDTPEGPGQQRSAVALPIVIQADGQVVVRSPMPNQGGPPAEVDGCAPND